MPVSPAAVGEIQDAFYLLPLNAALVIQGGMLAVGHWVRHSTWCKVNGST